MHLKINRILLSQTDFESNIYNIYNSKYGRQLHSGADFREVPTLAAQLFEWGKTTDTHALIKSSAMHYMIEHCHPFRDGNGRIGRLWQTIVLAKWNALFEWLPVETMIYHNQAKYYAALQQSQSKDGTIDCRPFIDFMLNVIEKSMCQYIDSADNPDNGGLFGGLNETEKEIISLITENPHIEVNPKKNKI